MENNLSKPKNISIENFRILISTEYPNDMSKIISDALKNYIIISNNNLYILQDNITYKYYDNNNIDKLLKKRDYFVNAELISSIFDK